MTRGECRLFYVADIHGSERCFRKWLNAAAFYGVDALLLGGDIAGKLLDPIVDEGGGLFSHSLTGRKIMVGAAELEDLKARLRASGRAAHGFSGIHSTTARARSQT